MSVFFAFLLALAVGTLSTLFWIPEEDLGRGYFQMNSLVVLGLFGLAGALLLVHPFQPFGSGTSVGNGALGLAAAASLLYWVGVFRERWRAARGAAALSLLAGGLALVAASQHLMQSAAGRAAPAALAVVAALSSAALLGWALVTMLLGHWYLVAPRLTFRHLVVFCWVLLAAVGVRCLSVAATLLAASRLAPGPQQPDPWRLLVGFEGQGMFLWFRLLWGLAIPLALGLMALHCARRRSNQSATGILYVLVVGVLIGEITAFYLTATTGMPV